MLCYQRKHERQPETQTVKVNKRESQKESNTSVCCLWTLYNWKTFSVGKNSIFLRKKDVIHSGLLDNNR